MRNSGLSYGRLVPCRRKAFCSTLTRSPMPSTRSRRMHLFPFLSKCLTKCADITASRGISPSLNVIWIAAGYMENSRTPTETLPVNHGGKDVNRLFLKGVILPKHTPQSWENRRTRPMESLTNTVATTSFPSRISPIKSRNTLIGNRQDSV